MNSLIKNLKLSFKIAYIITLFFGVFVFSIVSLHDSVVYLRAPLVLRQAMINFNQGVSYNSLTKDQHNALEAMVLKQECPVNAKCDYHVSSLSKNKAQGAFKDVFGRNFWGNYLYANINLILLFNFKFLLPFLSLFFIKKVFLKELDLSFD
jgi:hypothetical protein